MKDTLKAYCVFLTALLLGCSLSADTLRLKHRNSARNPNEAQALLATHLLAFAEPSFNEHSLNNLLKQGLSSAEATASLKSVSMLYEPLSGDILLSGANEKALNAVADAIIETGLGIYFDAVQAHILATEAEGDHALAERLKNEIYSAPAEIHWQVDRSAEATTEPQASTHARPSRWEPPLSTAALPAAEALAKDLTTDYKTYAPGILIPAGAERAITRDGKTTITSILSAEYYPSYAPNFGAEEQARNYEYLLLSLSLGTPHGTFESMWHGAFVLRKPIGDNHWDNAEVFTPVDGFAEKMRPYLSDAQIEALLHQRR